MNNINDISISMLIDNDIKSSIYSDNINEFKPLPLKSSINIDERRIYQWVPDENVSVCYNCNVTFSLLNRRHHCRNCGKIFCGLCSKYFIEIPNNIKTVPKETNLLDYKTYLEYFNDERSDITLRDLLDMSSGLDFPSHEHEKMFFQADHLAYAKTVGVEKDAGQKFEYNNVNSMLLGDILFQVTGKKADILFEDRILKPLEISDYKLWKDENGNVLTYCCVDMSARDYSKLGLLFARDGIWNGEEILSKKYIDETFQLVWDSTPERFTRLKRGYSLHWWVSAYEEEFKIFNTSGKFGQYTFVDRKNDIVITRITKYNQQDSGDVQMWGPMKYLRWAGVENAINIGRVLIENGAIKSGSDVITPFTDSEGESKEFNDLYGDFIGAIEDLSCDCYLDEAFN